MWLSSNSSVYPGTSFRLPIRCLLLGDGVYFQQRFRKAGYQHLGARAQTSSHFESATDCRLWRLQRGLGSSDFPRSAYRNGVGLQSGIGGPKINLVLSGCGCSTLILKAFRMGMAAEVLQITMTRCIWYYGQPHLNPPFS